MSKKTVIIIDDEESLLEILEHIIKKRYGIDAIRASNGMDALEKLDKQKFDLIITDVNMPEMDGVSFVEELKKSLINRLTPVIVLSAALDVKNVKALALKNVLKILTKPVNNEMLFEVADEYLKD